MKLRNHTRVTYETTVVASGLCEKIGGVGGLTELVCSCEVLDEVEDGGAWNESVNIVVLEATNGVVEDRKREEEDLPKKVRVKVDVEEVAEVSSPLN